MSSIWVANIHLNEPYDVYIGRVSFNTSGDTTAGKWGNPYRLDHPSERAQVIHAYIQWVLERPAFIDEIRRELKGKRLGCYCAPALCHGDILALIANGGPEVVENLRKRINLMRELL